MTPHIARLRNYTYSLIITVSIKVNITLFDKVEINLPEKTIQMLFLQRYH